MNMEHFQSDLAQLLDREAYDRLCATFPGITLYVKKSYSDDDEIVKLLGRENADLLADYLGGVRVPVPMGYGRIAKIKALRAAKPDITMVDLALAVGISERRLYELLADKADTGQESFGF